MDKRTELNITPDDFLKFYNEFEISFDFKAIRKIPNSNAGLFGYIFRIINSNNEKIDLLSTPDPHIELNLILGKSNKKITVESVFYPRYLSGLAELNDTIYILGGYGSLSGD